MKYVNPFLWSTRHDPQIRNGGTAGRGDLNIALRDALAAYDIDAANVETLAVLGEIYTDLDDWNNAESYLRMALALDPNNLLALRNQAYLYEQQGKYQQAIDALDLALARSCPCPPGHGAVRAQQL